MKATPFYEPFLAWLSFFPQVVQAGCLPRPISIKLGNVSLPQNSQVAWGLKMAAGTPEQPLAFLPQWPTNDTFVYGSDGHCPPNYETESCTSFRGGQYLADGSSTATQPGPPVSAPWPYPQLSWVADSLKLNENVSLPNYPIGIARNDWGAQGYNPQMALGMGVNSSLIHTLISSGIIASRTWGLFFGMQKIPSLQNAQVDGGLVLGGYDKGKISGDDNEKAIVQLSEPSQACASGMVVTISDIILNFKNGSEASIFPQAHSNSLSACIIPNYPALFTIPRAGYFVNFERLTGVTMLNRSYGLNYYSMRYMRNDHIYDGDMTISFQGGFSVFVPNDHLVMPHVELDPKTGAYVIDNEQPDLVINTLQDANANDMSTLGRHFLSVAYLTVSQDIGMFTLWPAVQDGGHEELVAVDRTGTESLDLCSDSSTPTTAWIGSSGSSVAESPNANAAAKTKEDTTSLSTSSIVGAAIGSVVAVGLIALTVILLRRYRSQEIGEDVRHKIGCPAPIHEIGDYIRWPLPEKPELEGD